MPVMVPKTLPSIAATAKARLLLGGHSITRKLIHCGSDGPPTLVRLTRNFQSSLSPCTSTCVVSWPKGTSAQSRA